MGMNHLQLRYVGLGFDIPFANHLVGRQYNRSPFVAQNGHAYRHTVPPYTGEVYHPMLERIRKITLGTA